MKRTTLRIALQSNGRLRDSSMELLSKYGIKISDISARTLIAPTNQEWLEIVFVRHKDIPEYVQNNAVDFGIVGENILHETEYDVIKLKSFPFGKCRLVIAVPQSSSIQKISDLESERIATSYPRSLRKFLTSQKINASIIVVQGSTEVAPILGLADAICDLTQSGRTLEENSLMELTTIFSSQATIIASPIHNPLHEKITKLLQI